MVALHGRMNIAVRPLSLAFALLVSASCGGNEYPEGPFESVTLSRTGGFGFCPSEGDALSASIRQQNGEWVLESTIAIAAPAGTDASECLDEYSDDCLQSAVQAPIKLTAEQLESVQDAIHQVPAKQCDTDIGLSCDPCLITSIQVDGQDADGYCCGDLNQNFSEGFRNLAFLIDGLAN